MDLYDRITIDLLNHYAFVLHENVTDLTDEEVDVARKFATDLSKKTYKYKTYTDEFVKFANKQNFKGLTKFDYESLEKDLYLKIDSANSLLNIYDWCFKIYHIVDYNDYLLLGTNGEYGYVEKIKLRYNIKTGALSSCDIEYSDEMMELGRIYHRKYDSHDLTDARRI